MAVASGGVAAAGAVIALLFLPRRAGRGAAVDEVPRGTTTPARASAGQKLVTQPKVTVPKHVAKPRS
jgi:hypothetical protein